MVALDLNACADKNDPLGLLYEEAKDRDFLFSLFCEVKEREFQGLPHTQKEALLQMQFEARERDYAMRAGDLHDIVLFFKSEAVGRVLLRVEDETIHIMDLAISLTYRNRGLGTSVLRRLCRYAERLQLPLCLHVSKDNVSALALYRKAGFAVTDEDALYLSMRKEPEANLLQLRAIAQTLLDPASSPGGLRDGVHALVRLFGRYSLIKPYMPEGADGGDIYLDSGMALRPSDAAACTLEYRRTVEFLHGIRQAIGRLLEEREEGTLNILYAGCGPYATLLFPLLSFFEPEEISVSLLDINPLSLASARTVAEALGLLPYIDAFIQADAATYRYPEGKRLDMVITETMQVSLKKEPHVSVVQNLAPQLQPQGVLIPESIRVSAVLNYREKDEVSWPLLELTKETRFKNKCSDTVVITLPGIRDAAKQLYYRTVINIFADCRLNDNECSLTMPRRVAELPRLQGGEHIAFHYELSRTPDFVVKTIGKENAKHQQNPIRGGGIYV